MHINCESLHNEIDLGLGSLDEQVCSRIIRQILKILPLHNKNLFYCMRGSNIEIGKLINYMCMRGSNIEHALILLLNLKRLGNLNFVRRKML